MSRESREAEMRVAAGRVVAERDRYKAQVERLLEATGEVRDYLACQRGDPIYRLYKVADRIQSENSTEGGDADAAQRHVRPVQPSSRTDVAGGGPAEQSGSAPATLSILLGFVEEVIDRSESSGASEQEVSPTNVAAYRNLADHLRSLLDTNAEGEGT